MKAFLAMYKGVSNNSIRERFEDKIIRCATKGKYSHCEIAFSTEGQNFICFSSSPRDNGVRQKTMPLPHTNWDLIPIEADNVEALHRQVIKYYVETQGKSYDLLGALGIILPFRHNKSRFFCSEWCFNALKQSNEGWRFSPNHLPSIFL